MTSPLPLPEFAAHHGKVHALIVGVGAYETLQALPPERRPAVGGDLKAIDSAAISAAAFAKWVREEQVCHGLARTEPQVLISAPGVPAADPKLVPTLANLRAAFQEWYRRCDEDRESLAVFYFAGHGFGLGEVLDGILLPEDFGTDPNRPLDHAISFTLLAEVMKRCQAGTQIFLLDHCRQDIRNWHYMVNRDPLIDQHEAVSLQDLDPDLKVTDPVSIALPAAREGGVAFGVSQQVSYFTKSLLRAVKGGGAEEIPHPVRWAVTVRSLPWGLEKLLCQRRDLAGRILPYVPPHGDNRGNLKDPEEFGIVHCPGDDLEIPCLISCQPPAATALANLSALHEENEAKSLCCAVRQEEEWDVDLSLGDYLLTATFPGGEYGAGQSSLNVHPPHGLGAIPVAALPPVH